MPITQAAYPDLSLGHSLSTGIGFFHAASATFSVLPNKVTMRSDEAGIPVLLIQSIRGSILSEPYGNFAMAVEAEFPTASVFEELRQTHRNAGVRPANLHRGALRFSPSPDFAGDADVTNDIVQTNEMYKTGITGFEVRRRITAPTTSYLRDAVIEGAMPFVTHTEYRYRGVSPRLPVTVEFDPRELLARLHEVSGGTGVIIVDDLSARLHEDVGQLPLQIQGTVDSEARVDFVATIIDRISHRFRHSESNVGDTAGPQFSLIDVDSVGSGQFIWDLQSVLIAERSIIISSSPFEALTRGLSADDRRSLVDEVTLPDIFDGVHRINAYGNFASNVPVTSMGAHIRVPPNPPHRAHGISKTIQLDTDDREGSASIRFTPTEEVAYSYQAFVVINTQNGIVDCRGPRTTSSEHILLLGPDDFAASLMRLKLSASLAREADVNVECSFTVDDREHSIRAGLSESAPEQALLVPSIAIDIRIQATVSEKTGNGEIVLQELAMDDLTFDHFSFPEYGSHTVEIRAEFADGIPLMAVEVAAEARENPSERGTIVSLTPDRPSREWSWLARSIFRPGYLYRLLNMDGEPLSPEWLSPPDYESPLVLKPAEFRPGPRESVESRELF